MLLGEMLMAVPAPALPLDGIPADPIGREVRGANATTMNKRERITHAGSNRY
jgi:hypothetical protein